MTASYKAWMFDDSCHQYTTIGSSTNFAASETGSAGNSDEAIAYLDGDFLTAVTIEESDNHVRHSHDGGLTWTLPGIASSNFGCNTLSVSGGEGKILLCADSQDDTDFGGSFHAEGAQLQLSTDGAVTWTAVGTNLGYRKWNTSCFATGAQVMYASANGCNISKSTDGGITWADLSGSPSDATDPTAFQFAAQRIRCNGSGSHVIYNCGYTGKVYVSTDAGGSWSNPLSLIASSAGRSDCGVSDDGSVMVVSSFASNAIYKSTDAGATWTFIDPAPITPITGREPTACNVSQDGQALVVGFSTNNDRVKGGVAVSLDQGATWNQAAVSDFDWLAAFIFDQNWSPSAPSGHATEGGLIGATYRRTSALAAESPAFVGWHRHDFGHGRTLQSIGVTSDAGGLLDHLDMLTTDGTNYYVEGLTQIFDEDDALQDAWFVDGGLVPDSAYEDTVSAVTGIRFTGLWYLIGASVAVFCVGLDLGDYVVEADGTVFVPYGSGIAPSSFDYTAPGAGAPLFTWDFITTALQSTDVRNGGIPFGSKFMPCCIGFPYTSEGQSLRPATPQDTGARTGPALGDRRRSHYVKAILHNTLGIEFGTDFAKMRPSSLKNDAGTQPLPTAPFSGVWRETLEDDYSFDSMVAWRITRPYPASVVSIGASIETQDA